MIICKKCSSQNDIKSGHIRGFHRYRCKDCGCQFTPTKRQGIHPLLRQLGVLLYAHCGASMRGIASIFGVSTVAVMKWIRNAADAISPQKSAAPTIVQVDKMGHFVSGKKQNLALEMGLWGITSISWMAPR